MIDEPLHASWLGAATDPAQLPPPVCAEIAFAGRSNVGKSSVINSLVNQRAIVRTSNTPGCTRAIHLVQATTRQGALLALVDLPGYGYAVRSHGERRRWAQAIDAYLMRRAGLRAVIVVVDARHPLQENDVQMLQYAQALQRTDSLVLATKLDKLPAQRRELALQKLRAQVAALAVDFEVVGFSAKSKYGRDRLWQILLGFSSSPASS